MHTWIAVGMVWIEAGTELLNGGVNLYRRNRLDAVVQSGRGIGATACAQDQRVVERVAGEDLVQAPVERLLILPGDHCLVTTSVIHVDDIATLGSGVEQDLVVR